MITAARVRYVGVGASPPSNGNLLLVALAVGLTFGLLGVLRLAGGWHWPKNPDIELRVIFQVMAFGILVFGPFAFNVFADVFSLLETRWVLNRSALRGANGCMPS